METQSYILRLSILRQRDTLHQLHNQFGLTRIDIEILVFSTEKPFFTLYDLQQFYCHTNVQQLRRSLAKLVAFNFTQIMVKGQKNKPTVYAVMQQGRQVIRQYYTLILDNADHDLDNNRNAVGGIKSDEKPLVSFSNCLLRRNVYCTSEK
jgi:hypothetical protein